MEAFSTVAIRQASKPMKSYFTPLARSTSESEARDMEPARWFFSS